MAYQLYHPSKIYVEKRIFNHPLTQKILAQFSHLSPIIFEDLTRIILENSTCQQNIGADDKPLVLAYQKSVFLKPCPGTRHYICCGYQILNLVNNCDINCSYCILQGYFNCSFIVVYVNIEDLFGELEKKLSRLPDNVFRIGTGELADSLSTDHLTGFSAQLVTFFSHKKNAMFELKTKTPLVKNFINLDHNGRTVVAWSLNTPRVISSEEPGAPRLEERLEAAQKCERAGFKLGFHFDPLIYYQGWEADYHSVVKKVFQQINSRNIIWISLGALRYPPHLDPIIRHNHPHSNIIYGELLPGRDRKLRYFKPIRIELFRKMYQWMKEIAPNVFVYLCMESSEVWQKSFGWTPRTSGGLKRRMDKLI